MPDHARSTQWGGWSAQLRVMTEPQEGATYDDLLSVAQEAERLGFDGFFRSDHYQLIGGDDPARARPMPG